MNWKRAEDRRRVGRQGAEAAYGSASTAALMAADRTAGASHKASQLAEPIVIDRWWKNRARDAVYVRLAPYKEHVLLDLRVWVTSPTDGISRPSKGLSLTVKHLPRLHAAIGKAMAEARARGLLDDGGEA